MNLSLTYQEHTLLIEVLELQLTALRGQIRRTETRSFRSILEQRERVIEQILEHLYRPERSTSAGVMA
jgi:hypothetical protein